VCRHDIIPGLSFDTDGQVEACPHGKCPVDHLIWGQEIFRSVTASFNKQHGPRNKTKPFETLTLSMYSSAHLAEHRFPVWWTGDVVYTMLLDNVHKMVDGGLALQPVHARPGRLSALSVPQLFPMKINFVWGFCMGAQGA
jgi:hypothetical protein